jgi:3-oxoacyl-[acyl-carrier protein] reductase
MGRLDGEVAIVTGANQGLGLTISKLFVSEGAKVALVDANPAVAETAAGIGENAKGFEGDVRSSESIAVTLEGAKSLLGTPTILVNNAGITRPAMLTKMTEEQWDLVLDTHLRGSFLWTQAVIPGMREKEHGRLIFSVSSAGINGTVGQANYAAAKSGMLGLMRSAARELGRYGILSNAVAPAAITPMTETVRTDPRFAEQYRVARVLGRWAEAEEVAPVYLFLASSESSYVTGQVISADGGGVFVR